MRQTLFIFGCVLAVIAVCFIIYTALRRNATKQLEWKNLQLQEVNDSKNRFLSRMSHELRTPLNAITGYATVTKQNLAAQEMDQKTICANQDAILRAANYQLAIIGDLLDIQKIESGQLELVKKEVEFAGYMEDMVEMIRPEADEKSISFQYEQTEVEKDTYLIDGVRFKQVLLNILHNAVKFTPAGGNVKMTAEVISRNDRTNTLKFVITDNGIGMSEDFVNHYLFHRFAQEYQGNTSPYEGCGTGLALSRDLIHLMGGEITCSSRQNEGSTFTVILTAERVDQRRRRRQRPQPSYDLSGVRVLLCEDNPMNQDMERKLLERMKCQVEIADNGAIASKRFEESENGYYDIILMDIRMPEMDGLEATRRIRSLDRMDAKVIPILAVSANAFEKDIQESLEAGMNEHLAKPVDAAILYQQITQYLQQIQKHEP